MTFEMKSKPGEKQRLLKWNACFLFQPYLPEAKLQIVFFLLSMTCKIQFYFVIAATTSLCSLWGILDYPISTMCTIFKHKGTLVNDITQGGQKMIMIFH